MLYSLLVCALTVSLLKVIFRWHTRVCGCVQVRMSVRSTSTSTSWTLRQRPSQWTPTTASGSDESSGLSPSNSRTSCVSPCSTTRYGRWCFTYTQHTCTYVTYMCMCVMLLCLCACSDSARLPQRPAKRSSTWKSERSTVPPDLQTGSFAAQSERHHLHPQHVRKQ